jgi:N6-L-threonylcarbamoyladenine synthase
MIACRGFYQAQAGHFSDHYLNAVPGLTLTDK